MSVFPRLLPPHKRSGAEILAFLPPPRPPALRPFPTSSPQWRRLNQQAKAEKVADVPAVKVWFAQMKRAKVCCFAQRCQSSCCSLTLQPLAIHVFPSTRTHARPA